MRGGTILGLAVLGVGTLQGCAQPTVMAGNERGGIVSQTNGTNEATGFALADAYCHRYGRVAQITGMDVLYNRMMFACVEP